MKHGLAALGLFLLFSCSMADDEWTPSLSDEIVNVGDTLPTFSVTMHDGSPLTTDSLKGKPSLLVLFSTTCPDCQRELPALDRRYRAHGGDTTFVAVAREQSDEAVSSYWESQHLILPFSAQTDRTVYALFARRGIPRIYISDASGIVRQVIVPLP